MPWTRADISQPDTALLRCPRCRGKLDAFVGALTCQTCTQRWPVDDDLPQLYQEEHVQGTDRLMRRIYNALPELHDPITDHILPWLQFDQVSTREMRQRYINRMKLHSLNNDNGTVRILEVGVGGGANLPMLDAALPPGLDVELWGLDLSAGMLRQCAQRLRPGGRPTRLLVGDVHALPFADATFDRVFHVGATGSFRDPGGALAEMARVARPGTPIVVVDEQLDAQRKNRLHHKALFKLLTFYDADPHSPSELLPHNAEVLSEEQISRFYYSLAFAVAA